MKIHSVETENIRQFLGKQRIDFSVDSQNNVTLVHGPNTAGKTTLLNAINWCLYGKFLTGFKESDRLVSEQVVGSEYGVTVIFSHDAKKYIVTRKSRARPTDSSLVLLVEEKSGRVVPHPQPQLLINKILPESLSEFFFFAGEMIKDGRSSTRGSRSTADDIRAVLGFTVAETAITDLSYILKKKNSELAELTKGTDLGNLSAQLNEREERLELAETQLTAAREAQSIFNSERQRIQQLLRGHESSSALQAKRERLEKQLGEFQANEKRARKNWRELIASHGHSIFWNSIAESANTFIDDAVTKRRIPSPYDQKFVSDLLADELCVCGRELKPGTKEFRCVSELINDATDEKTIRRALSVRGAGDRVIGLFQSCARQFQRAAEALSNATTAVETIEQDLARVRDLVKSQGIQQVALLEKELETVDEKAVSSRVQISRCEQEIEVEKSTIAELRKQIDRIEATSPQVDEVKHVIVVLVRLITVLKEELDAAQANGIAQIRAALNAIVSTNTRRKYVADVSIDFSVSLFREGEDGVRQRVHVLSSGEQRLVDLCFVSALVKVCRDRERDVSGLLVPGATAPLIVDAPFGELDPEYQSLAVSSMMGLADQLVLLLSKTHRTTEVDKAVRPRIGREWLLVASHRAPAGAAASVEVQINGQNYQQMFYGQPEDKTEFKEVSGGVR